jgi:hypothetical protein
MRKKYKMQEHTDYELITPEAAESDQSWNIRILTGDFIETIIRFGAIVVDGPNEQIKFNFDVIFSPMPDLQSDHAPLQIVAGEILNSVLEDAIESGTLEMKDLKETS